ncbi:MAG: hypothetical protein CM1200mP3_17960 [Chloroflexota bacterium]|nr:MAG: hypothetical protein CM1200mP3_17960 [Chloroflexota bacterium]
MLESLSLDNKSGFHNRRRNRSWKRNDPFSSKGWANITIAARRIEPIASTAALVKGNLVEIHLQYKQMLLTQNPSLIYSKKQSMKFWEKIYIPF